MSLITKSGDFAPILRRWVREIMVSELSMRAMKWARLSYLSPTVLKMCHREEESQSFQVRAQAKREGLSPYR